MTALIRLTRDGATIAACNAGCYNAQPGVCDCICGGLNHAVGRQQADINTQREGLERARLFCDAHPWTQSALIWTQQKAAPNLTSMLF